MFPRSQGTVPGRSATFRDCIARLDDIAAMGFDTIYLPPIHPIGEKNRKGRNNSVAGRSRASPAALTRSAARLAATTRSIPSSARSTISALSSPPARTRGMEVALDLAVQCAPDHPWIKQHPEWFEFRDDGSIRYAENPPKQYQDIVNVNFRSPAWPALWQAIRDIVTFWIAQGVHIFRVDNPHTKPFPFWEWLIREVQSQRPDILFLSEAFTRPKVMRDLAKLGFTQSYTYFTWRNDKHELIEYFTELTRDEPQGLSATASFHQHARHPAALPAGRRSRPPSASAPCSARRSAGFSASITASSCARIAPCRIRRNMPNSEKYEYKVWDWDRPGNIKPLIAALNRIRRAHAAFEDWRNLEFHHCDNDRVLFYSRGRAVFIAVSLDRLRAASDDDRSAAAGDRLERGR